MKTIFKKVFFFAVVGATLLPAGSILVNPLFAAPKAKAAAAEKAVKDDEVIPPEVTEADKNAATTEVKDSYYVERRSYGIKRIDGTNPEYAVRLSETGIGVLKNVDWLIAGIDYRLRSEYRHNDLRRPNATATLGPNGQKPDDDIPHLLRARFFAKIQRILDPFRFTVEIEDARRYPYWSVADDPTKNPRTPPYVSDNRDNNSAEPINLFGELYFKNLFGYDRPLHLRVGRMAFEFLDRRMIGLNEWRNTTNTFQGVRTTIGQEKNNWYLELLAFQPLQRNLETLDITVGKEWFSGAILSIQEWSHIATLQPYYLNYQRDQLTATSDYAARGYQNVHTFGLRAYGVFAQSGFDYDASYTHQLGVDQIRAGGHRSKSRCMVRDGGIGLYVQPFLETAFRCFLWFRFGRFKPQR